MLVALGGQPGAVRAPIWGKAFGSLDEPLGDPSVDAVQYDRQSLGLLAAEDLSRDPWSVVMRVFGERGPGVFSFDAIKNDDQPSPAWDDGAYWDSFLNLQRYFVEECLGRGAQPLSTPPNA